MNANDDEDEGAEQDSSGIMTTDTVPTDAATVNRCRGVVAK
jgi:hypothetical protein